jgi:hypothetical protein
MENKRFRDLIIIMIISVLLGALLTSCSKEEITPGNYSAGTVTVGDPNNWQSQYQDGGVLPTWGTGPSGTNNELVGTTWVLTKVVSGFSTTYPNDTIRFVSNTNYTLNNGAVRPYTLSSSAGTTNKTLTLNFFQPFGGSHYSGQVGFYFVTDGVITNAEFRNIQNTTSTLRAWFTKV